MEEIDVVPMTFAERCRCWLANWKVWAFGIGFILLAVLALTLGRSNTEKSLGDAVDLFKCCILTWKALVIVLPAFIAAGAIVTFVPDSAVMRYLGRGTAKWKSYGVASITGMLLSVCSCNVVPIFMGIIRRGAGIGPAFAFVYAAPAINIVTMIMILQIVGPYMALIRGLAVPLIAIITGLLMAFIFRKEDEARQKQGNAAALSLNNLSAADGASTGRALIIVALSLSVLLFGAWDEMGPWVRDHIFAWVLPAATLQAMNWALIGIFFRVFGALGIMGLAAYLSIRWYSKEEAVEWMRQTGILLKTVLPIFIPAVLAIAIVVNQIPIQWLHVTAANPDAFVFGHPNGNRFLQVFVSTLFGALMYFPLLTEIAFVKGLLINDLALGPAMAILLTGPGLSLPGLLLLFKIVGAKKTLVYFLIMVALVALISYYVGYKLGPYECVCRQLEATF